MAKKKVKCIDMRASQPELAITVAIWIIGFILLAIGYFIDIAKTVGGCLVGIALLLGLFMPITKKEVEIEVDDNEEKVATAKH